MRREDCIERLLAVRDRHHSKPFEWGRNDCCTYAAACVNAVTGAHPMSEFRGKYRSEKGAAKALKNIGRGSLYHTLRSKFRRIPVAQAQRGDLVLFKIDGAPTLMVCMGQQCEGPGVDGLKAHPTLEGAFAFKVE